MLCCRKKTGNATSIFRNGIIAIAVLAHLITFLIFSSLNADAQNLPQFTDITDTAGINFVHNSGAFGKKYLPETMGSGCAFIDYNNDGWQDILLVNGKDWEGNLTQKRQTMALYRNNGDGTFIRCHRNRRTRYTALRYGCCCRRLRQRRRSRHLY